MGSTWMVRSCLLTHTGILEIINVQPQIESALGLTRGRP